MLNPSIFAAFERMWQHVVAKLSTKAEANHNHDDNYDEKGAATGALNQVIGDLSAHNTSDSAHNDIRALISALTERLDQLGTSNESELVEQLTEVRELIETNRTDLEELLNAKVNISDIVDNLTSTDTSQPLSANQGKELKGLIDALQEAVNNKVNTDHTHDDLYYTEAEVDTLIADIVASANEYADEKIDATISSHTHNYAGSSSAGGAATTALTCTGNSETATKATQDGNGNVIFDTYATKSELSNKTSEPYKHEITEVAHRGWSQAPENTLPAWQEAYKLGFRYMEGDVTKTQDGVYVMLHDNTIDRTSDGSGDISTLTYAQASAYDYGSWKGSQYTGTKLPTFEEFINFCRNTNIHPYIELKYNLNETDIVNIINIVSKYKMLDNCTWISFNTDWLMVVRNNLPYARIGVSNSGITEARLDTLEPLRKTGSVFYFGELQFLNETNLELARNRGIEVEAWSCSTAGVIKNAHPYISGFCVDYIRVADELNELAGVSKTSDGGTVLYSVTGAGSGIYANGNTTADNVNSVVLADPTKKLKRIKIYARFPYCTHIQEFSIADETGGNDSLYGARLGGIFVPTADNVNGVNRHYFSKLNFCVNETTSGWIFQVTDSGWMSMGIASVATTDFANNSTTKLSGTEYPYWNQRHNSDYVIYKIIGYID